MAKVWVRALGKVFYDDRGRKETARAGDWIQIGKHRARLLLAQGMVEVPAPHRRVETLGLDKCGVVIRLAAGQKEPDASVFGNLQHVCSGPVLPYDYTAIWTPSLSVTQWGFESGLMRLSSAELRSGGDSWEALATLVSTTTLAGQVGSPEEQAKTKEVVGDLRLPVYDTRLLWFRKTPATQTLIKRWVAELAEGADEQHSFLRALYRSRVMLCTLPPGWQDRKAPWKP